MSLKFLFNKYYYHYLYRNIKILKFYYLSLLFKEKIYNLILDFFI